MPSTHSPIFIPQITLIAFLYFLVLSPRPSLSFNITALLSTFPEFSQFTALIAPLSDDLSHRSSLSLLAVPNSVLSSDDRLSRHQLTPSTLPDVLRYHVLLQYLSWSDLRSLPPSGKLITTLYQTTGRATGNLGSVNLTCDPVTGLVSIHPPTPSSSSSAATNATVLSLVKTLPYNVSIFSVNALLIPGGFDLMASETGPTSFINITKALIDGHNFNVVASLLSASGVVEEFESDEGGAGITLFVPVDDAFADLPASISLQSLPADKKAVVLRFHVLHSYYPLGSLQSITNPSQPTLATEAMGAGFYTLNISAFNGSLAINSGIVQASVTQTVFDEKPVSIFGISRVLLPKEIFGKNPIVSSRTAPQDGAPPPEEDAHSPETSPGLDGSPSHLSSPPGLRDDVLSEGAVHGSESFVVVVVLCCIGLYLVV